MWLQKKNRNGICPLNQYKQKRKPSDRPTALPTQRSIVYRIAGGQLKTSAIMVHLWLLQFALGKKHRE